jgi:glucose/arabinose dehydrogenase
MCGGDQLAQNPRAETIAEQRPQGAGNRSPGNLGLEPEPKATIQRFDADGSNQMSVASGTRNPTAPPFTPTPASCGH